MVKTTEVTGEAWGKRFFRYEKTLYQIQKRVTDSSSQLKKLVEVIEVEKASGISTLYTAKFK